MIVFGGWIKGARGITKNFSDTWELDLKTMKWKEIKTKDSPPDVHLQCGAMYDSDKKRMIILISNGTTSTWSLNLKTMKYEEIETEGKTPRNVMYDKALSAIYDPEKKRMIVLDSGCNTWELDLTKNEWGIIERDEEDESPPKVNFSSAIYDSENKRMLIFGGIYKSSSSDPGLALSETWELNLETMKWKEIETKEDETPPPRYHHTAIYNSDKKRMIIFGGFCSNGILDDIWELDLKTMKWKETEVKNSPALFSHSAIYNHDNKKMIIFGGVRDRSLTISNTIWALDIEKKKWKKVSSK